MLKLTTVCDRCGDVLHYKKDALVEGAIFTIPTISLKGNITFSSQPVILCKGCIYHLGRFMNCEI